MHAGHCHIDLLVIVGSAICTDLLYTGCSRIGGSTSSLTRSTVCHTIDRTTAGRLSQKFPFSFLDDCLDELLDFCCCSHPEQRDILTLFKVFRRDIKRKVGKGVLCLM